MSEQDERASERQRETKLLRAIGGADDSFIEEADPERDAAFQGAGAENPTNSDGKAASLPAAPRPRFLNFRTAGVLAAAAVLAIGAGVFLNVRSSREPSRSMATVEETQKDEVAEKKAESPTEVPAAGASEEAAEDNNFSPAALGNPFVDYASLEAAEEAAGFTFSAPETIGDGNAADYSVMDGVMIQIIYRDAGGNETGCVRKEKLTEADASDTDISGDYNSYENDETRVEDGISYRLRGNGTSISTVTWVSDGFAYSITADEPLTDAETALGLAKTLEEE